MGDASEHILEGRPDPRGPWGARIKVALTIAGLVALPTFALTAPRHHTPAPAPSETAQPPTPLAVGSPNSVGSRLLGQGPFVVYRYNGGPYFAVDLSRREADPIHLGNPPGGEEYYSAIQPIFPQTWGTAVPVVRQETVRPADTEQSNGENPGMFSQIWMLSAGVGFDDPPIRLTGNLVNVFPTQDASKLFAMWATDTDLVDATVVPADGTLPRTVASFPAYGSYAESGALSPVAWLPDGTVLLHPTCQCVPIEPPHWYAVSPSGTVSTVAWLSGLTDGSPGVSRNGHLMSFFEQPLRECADGTCPAGPFRVMIADAVKRTVHEIARFADNVRSSSDVGQNSTALSADGTLVATSMSGDNRALVLDVQTGKTVSTVFRGDLNLKPLAFVDDATLVLTDGKALFTADISSSEARITEIAHSNAQFVGWVR